MTYQKRLFDIVLALMLSVVLGPVILVLAAILKGLDDGPVFYLSERMKTPTEGFTLIKFRTMREVTENAGVSGGDKGDRITPVGRFLRASRLDEVPQLWNVLRGDISFVGPRPPLREYVERYPDIYQEVLHSRPGITGLATVRFHAHEEWWLHQSQTAEQTDTLYTRNCIPRKARLDLIYQAHQSMWFDMRVMLETVVPNLRRL